MIFLQRIFQHPFSPWMRLILYPAALIFILLIGWFFMIRMPGKSFVGPLPPLTGYEQEVRDSLRRDVEMLAGTIGERNIVHPEKLAQAADYIHQTFENAGYAPQRQAYINTGVTSENIIAEIPGNVKADEIVVIGAHYDSVVGTVGANDNGSGVAAVLSLARSLAGQRFSRTLRLVAFVNEEPPFFVTGQMGSMVYAQSCQEKKENVVGMISLETIGYFSDEEGSQHYPPLLSYFYPSTGNFIAIVGNMASGRLVREIVKTFRETTSFPSEGGTFPEVIPGVGWSDHWSFWQAGYPAAMVTDTAPFRYPHYHKTSDTPDKIDYDRTARVVVGMEKVIRHLVGGERQ